MTFGAVLGFEILRSKCRQGVICCSCTLVLDDPPSRTTYNSGMEPEVRAGDRYSMPQTATFPDIFPAGSSFIIKPRSSLGGLEILPSNV